MGNRVSIAQEERDEAEFQSLVNAVTFARQSEGIYDLESGRHANNVDSIESSNRPYYEANDRRTYDSYTQYSSAGNSFRHVSRRSQRPVHTPVPVIPPTAPAVVPGYMIPVSCSPITIVPPTQSNIVLPQTRPHSLSTIAESTSQPHAGIALPDSLHLPIAVEAPVPFRPIATDISEDDDWDAVSPVPSLASSRPPSAPPGPPQTVIVVPSQGSPISDHNEKDSAGKGDTIRTKELYTFLTKLPPSTFLRIVPIRGAVRVPPS
ncbi:hypothetical protein BDY19DRAFT_992444 [Irpex rosettiformis]|uniref:Uncharacterized protein n=1 Tax=Irpex rosettiformis TaxID=378272 RepID=A0ACB8U779_9APHY|nr:hypothetical protein BDY19DRAFT_992444 [Irpex rosettiformis]